jgi:hypothetical protein
MCLIKSKSSSLSRFWLTDVHLARRSARVVFSLKALHQLPQRVVDMSARLGNDFSHVQMFSSHLSLTRPSYLQRHPIVHRLHIHYVNSLRLHCFHLLNIIVFQLSCLGYIVTRASSANVVATPRCIPSRHQRQHVYLNTAFLANAHQSPEFYWVSLRSTAIKGRNFGIQASTVMYLNTHSYPWWIVFETSRSTQLEFSHLILFTKNPFLGLFFVASLAVHLGS